MEGCQSDEVVRKGKDALGAKRWTRPSKPHESIVIAGSFLLTASCGLVRDHDYGKDKRNLNAACIGSHILSEMQRSRLFALLCGSILCSNIAA